MTVGSLLRILDGMNPDAEVFVSEPHYKDAQENHTAYGARCVVSHGNYIWFETYGDEDIGYEVDCIADYAREHAVSDNDFIDMIFAKDGHGYTMEDIRSSCEPSVYYWLRDNEYRKEMYPDNGNADWR